VRRRDDGHLKPRLTESIEYIWAVDADMVVLAIDPLTLNVIYDGGVFEGWIIRPHWNLDQAPATGFHNSVQFCHRRSVIGHVLQNMTAMNDLGTTVCQWQGTQVGPYCDEGTDEVETDVPK
jgi:hypothetical protein